MPVVTVTLIEGYDEATRRRLSERLTDAVRATIDAPAEGITVILNEVAPGSYMRGRRGRKPGPPQPPAAQVALDFLAAMEARDLEGARGFLAEDFEMTFPGGVRFSSLEELLDWAGPRYRRIAKTMEGVEEVPAAHTVTVYCRGTLSGEAPDGTPFSGIRFIDRFEVAEGKLRRQEVWNDLGEVSAEARRDT